VILKGNITSQKRKFNNNNNINYGVLVDIGGGMVTPTVWTSNVPAAPLDIVCTELPFFRELAEVVASTPTHSIFIIQENYGIKSHLLLLVVGQNPYLFSDLISDGSAFAFRLFSVHAS
jgi:hypothetical protein